MSGLYNYNYCGVFFSAEFPPPRDPNYKYTSNEMIEFFWKPPDSIQSYNYSVCSDFSNLKQCSNTSELFECFKKSNMPLVVNVSVLFGNCVGAPATITIEPGMYIHVVHMSCIYTVLLCHSCRGAN